MDRNELLKKIHEILDENCCDFLVENISESIADFVMQEFKDYVDTLDYTG